MVSLTSILVLVTLGLAVIAGMMGIFNLAHGEFVLVGALTSYQSVQLGLPIWAGLVLAPIVVGLMGALLELTVIRRLYLRPLHAILATWAISVAIRGLVTKGLRTTARSVPYPIAGNFDIAGTEISIWRTVVIGATPILIVSLYWLLRRSEVGLRLRAALENPELARAAGVRTSRIYFGTFVLGSAIAGFVGAMVAPLTSVYPQLGVGFLVDSFLALMVGGLGSVESAVLGAGILGVSGGVLRYIIQPAFSGAVVLALSIAVMRLRPEGIVRS